MFVKFLKFLKKDLAENIIIQKRNLPIKDNISRYELLIKELLIFIKYCLSLPINQKPILQPILLFYRERCYINTKLFFEKSDYFEYLQIYNKLQKNQKILIKLNYIRSYILKLIQLFIFILHDSNIEKYKFTNIELIINKAIFYTSIYYDLLLCFYLNM